jgi:ferredoxin-NADP reductase
MPEDGQPCPFEPGMFMMISGIDAAGKKYVGRAFSIASDPSTPGMEFMVIKEPVHGDHVGRSHFVDANVGDVFMLKGPSGQFRFNPATDKKVGFLAGGTGLAPFTSMLRHIKVTNSQNDAVLFYSTKYPTEIIWKDELNSYVSDLGLKLVITVTRPQPGDGWTGPTGHIDAEMIRKYAPDFMERGFYICGPLKFVKALRDALTSLGVPANKVSADVWG